MCLITGDIVYPEFWKDHSGCGVENGLMGVIEKVIGVKEPVAVVHPTPRM